MRMGLGMRHEREGGRLKPLCGPLNPDTLTILRLFRCAARKRQRGRSRHWNGSSRGMRYLNLELADAQDVPEDAGEGAHVGQLPLRGHVCEWRNDRDLA